MDDDHFRFPVPLPFEISPTLNQMKSPENPWEISQMPSSSSPHHMNNLLPLKGQSFYFKTRMCVRFKSARCPNGDSCNFAHSSEELRRPLSNGAANRASLPHKDFCFSTYRQNPNMPNGYVWINQSEELKLYKNKVCRKFYIGGVCPYGDKCSFLHVEPGSLQDTPGDHNELLSRQNPQLWKTKLCHRWSTSGKCPYGDHCNHAHGDSDLRKVELDLCEVDGNNSISTAPSKVSSSLSNGVLEKVKPQPISLSQPSSRIKTLTLEKCKRIYGDWIDN